LKAGFHETARDLEKLAMVVTLLGMVAFSMAAIGIIGLVAYAVSQQKKEIAIRIALGAEHLQLLATVLRQFSWPLIWGLVTGAGITAGLSKTLRKTLYGISNLDPMSYVVALAVLALVTGIAAVMPAKRALRLNVSKTLRYD
jgi:ABC-type antimicrobial peptide transport system permease subunit